MLVLGLSAPWLISIRMQSIWIEFVSELIYTYQRQLECRPPSWIDFWLSAYAFRHSLNWVGCDSVSSKSQILTPSENRSHNPQTLACKLGCVTGLGEYHPFRNVIRFS